MKWLRDFWNLHLTILALAMNTMAFRVEKEADDFFSHKTINILGKPFISKHKLWRPVCLVQFWRVWHDARLSASPDSGQDPTMDSINRYNSRRPAEWNRDFHHISQQTLVEIIHSFYPVFRYALHRFENARKINFHLPFLINFQAFNDLLLLLVALIVRVPFDDRIIFIAGSFS